MSVIAPFTLTPEQQSRLLAATAAREEGESEERLQSLRQREEDVDTLQRCSEILTAGRFAAGIDLSIDQLLDLLTLVRTLAPNPNLDARLLANPGDPGVFNGVLRDLLYGSDSVPIRLRRFLARRHFGSQTALQLLCAVYPEDWPLVTQDGLRQLDLSREQVRAANQTALAYFGMSAIVGSSIAGDESVPTLEVARPITSQDPPSLPTNDPVLMLLGQVIVYRAVRALVAAPDFIAVHRLLTSDMTGRYGRSTGRHRLHGRRLDTLASGPPDKASMLPATRVREPEPTDYDVASTTGQPAPGQPSELLEIDSISTDQMLAELETEVERRGFSYPPLFLRNYYLCLQSKPYVWLLGANGIGKTRLTSLFAELLTGDPAHQYRLIPVRPDWADSAPVLGYVNLLAAGGEGRYISTPFLDFLIRAAQPDNANRAYFLCFDEMNLARVEHYFAEVLSAMETPGRELLLANGRSLRLPANFFITGTLNTDEATYPLARKVLDRANTISLQTVSLRQFPEQPPSPANSIPLSFALRQAVFLQRRVTDIAAANARLREISEQNLAGWVVERLIEINAILEPHDLPIAYRLRDEALCYCANSFDADGSGLLSPTPAGAPLANLVVAVDFQLLQKVLPRLGGTQDRLAPLLHDLLHWAERAGFARTAAKLNRLLARLQRDGFVSFE